MPGVLLELTSLLWKRLEQASFRHSEYIIYYKRTTMLCILLNSLFHSVFIGRFTDHSYIFLSQRTTGQKAQSTRIPVKGS